MSVCELLMPVGTNLTRFPIGLTYMDLPKRERLFLQRDDQKIPIVRPAEKAEPSSSHRRSSLA